MKRKTAIKNSIKVVIFLVAVLLGIEVLSVVVRPKDNTKESGTTNYQAKAIYTEPENTIDVIAIGASNFWCGYSPMQVWENQGYTTYNCGTLMQEIWYTYYFLEKIYETQTPKVVFVDADVLFLEYSDITDNVNDMIKYTLQWRFPVMEYHNRWKTLSKADFTTEVAATNDNAMKGFYYVNLVEKYEDENDFMEQDFQNEEITFLDVYFLEKIQKLCEEHGTKMVLLEAPAERAWNDVRRDAVMDYAEAHNLEFLDANVTDIGIDWDTDTRDAGFHLNYNGAKKFTSYVENYLVNECDLTDHRNDPAYSGWNDALILYKQTVGEQ